jgi:hypothetical protein
MPNNGLDLGLGWKWYEKRIAGIFRRIKGAEVKSNVYEMGQDTHKRRQIDIRIQVPLKVNLGEGFVLTIPVKIVVDCKKRKRPIDIRVVDAVEGLRDDLRAHLAIIVTPKGVSDGAMNRAKAVAVRPIVITTDLIAVAEGFREYEFVPCSICEYTGNEEYPQPEISWRSKVEGYCDWCGGLHVRCPDCYEIFGISEAEYDQAIKCPSDCGAIFFARSRRGKDEPPATLESFPRLDAMLLTVAYHKSTKRLTPNEVKKLVRMTRWQHWGEAPATIGVTESGYMEYGRDDNLYLTAEGKEWAKLIDSAVYPICY